MGHDEFYDLVGERPALGEDGSGLRRDRRARKMEITSSVAID